MSKLARVTQKVFGSTAPSNKIAKFGSLAAGTPAFTTDPTVIQSLSQFLAGWTSAVVGSNSPAIEDMNAICYLYAYQIAYVLQSGVAEWNAATTYYIGSVVSDGIGGLYSSVTDTNLNHGVTDGTNWRRANGPYVVSAPSSPYTISAADAGKTFDTTTVASAVSFTLPAATQGFQFTVKDVGGNAASNAITIARAGGESIEGLAASYICESNYGSWTCTCDGTNWWIS